MPPSPPLEIDPFDADQRRRESRRRLAPVAALVLVALVALAWRGSQQNRRSSTSRGDRIELPDPTRGRTGYLIVPAQRQDSPSRAETLEAKLAAFAQTLDRRRASEGAPEVPFRSAELERELTRAIARIDDRAHISVHVRDLETDEVLFDYFGGALLNPASNHKLLTSAAALDLLGPEYGFATEALRVGRELYLVGHGDPTLDDAGLRALADEVAGQIAVGELERIVVDDSAFSPRTFAPGFDPEGPGVSYQAPSGALSLDFNTVEVTVHGVAGQEQPEVRVSPANAHVVVRNEARRGSGRLSIRSLASAPSESRDDRRTIISVQGRLRAGAVVTERRRVVDPGLFTGSAFAAMLSEATGTPPLPVVAGVVARAEGDPELVALRESPPLLEIVERELSFSNNFVAEQLLRTLGWRMTGAPGDWENGAEVLAGYWAAVGNDPSGLVFENGSGMSELGRVTTSGLVDLVASAHRNRSANGGLIDALPVAGEVGTLRARLRGSGRRVRAKTGTMDGISGLTGVITSESGEPRVAFSVLINVDEGKLAMAKARRQVEDRIVMAVLAQLDRWELERWQQARRAGG